MNIGIIGNGFVGQATQILKCNHNNLIIYDIDPSKCYPEGTTLESLAICNIIFISVPTPMDNTGRNHLGIVESVVSQLQKVINTNKTFIVIRSTVLPNTSDRLGCYFMPEFLTEKNWANDFKTCKNWIFGLLGKSNDEQFKKTISTIFKNAHQSGKIDSDVLHFVSNSEAEMIKYFRNCFLAMKVSFCNEIASLCESKNINYENVRNLATLDERIGASHSTVPGHDGKKGFGGTCFPKDTLALLREFEDSNVESFVLKGAVERNSKIDRPEQDWSENVGRAVL